MTGAQSLVFLEFVRGGLADRSRAFVFPDQRGGTVLVRMTKPYVEARTGPRWVYRIELEILP
ncbi:short-chain dehydrogenase/reductase SDR [Roseibium sp. TrichSKD4]|nr:short-chain dehydrogenase/reductase SDR [Roseibium sp. TrichSKD4]